MWVGGGGGGVFEISRSVCVELSGCIWRACVYQPAAVPAGVARGAAECPRVVVGSDTSGSNARLKTRQDRHVLWQHTTHVHAASFNFVCWDWVIAGVETQHKGRNAHNARVLQMCCCWPFLLFALRCVCCNPVCMHACMHDA